MNKLSQTAIMALAGGAIAGVSFLAGKREGIQIGKVLGRIEANELSEQIGYVKALGDVAKNMIKSKAGNGGQ